MPTGYTAAIAEGISFPDFVMRCARAMGACVMMRDDPMDAEIPEEFKASTYHTDQIDRLAKERCVLMNTRPEEADAAAEEEHREAVAERKRIVAERGQLRAKYEDMLEKVRAWTPPTADHAGLQSFMMEQITESIRFDCEYGSTYDESPKQVRGSEWHSQRLSAVLQQIADHERENEKEIERVRGRTEWVRALRESLHGENQEKDGEAGSP